MATYHHHGRGGKRLVDRTPQVPMVDVESMSPSERKIYEQVMEGYEKHRKEMDELMANANKLLYNSSSQITPEMQIKTTEDTDMETHDDGQNLEQKNERTTTDTESTAKTNTEPPPKKRKKKKKKQNKAKNTEDTQITNAESSTSSPIAAATSLPQPDAIVNSYKAPPIEVATVPPTTSETVQPVKHIKVLVRGCDVPVKIERFRGGNSPTQCFNCQNFGHTQRNCCSPPRCVKCAAGHRSYLCQKDINIPPKCCNCGEAHTANYTGCSIRPPRRGHRVTPATVPTTKAGKAHRLVSILKELQELLKDRELFQLLQSIMSSSE
nr:uncharacterized protein LOC122271985 [Parasteatoda tepidariorum]